MGNASKQDLDAGNTLEFADTGAMNLHLCEATAENCTIANGYYNGATTSSAVSLESGSHLVNSIVYGNRSRATVAGVKVLGAVGGDPRPRHQVRLRADTRKVGARCLIPRANFLL